MVSASNTSSIATSTGRSWEDWVSLLDARSARLLDHTAIARLALELMPTAAPNEEWWAQGVAVAYEQHAGLRVPGQSCSGDFRASASRTLPTDRDGAVAAWRERVGDLTEFRNVPLDGEPSESRTEKWSYWRARLADGSRIAVNATDKQPGKAVLSIEHGGLTSAEEGEQWRAYWKALLKEVTPRG